MPPIPSTAIVVPCYNEAARLDLGQFRDFIARHREQVYFIFVDDGSTDGTIQVLERLRITCPGVVKIHRLPHNSGKAETIRQGILQALRHEVQYVGFWDADLATPLEVISTFYTFLEEQPRYNMIFGARVQLLGRTIERCALRHYLGRLFSTAVSLILHLKIYDSQCGAKLFRASPQLLEIFSEPFLSRWVFDVEILARLVQMNRKKGCRSPAETVWEYPLPRWCDVAGSNVHCQDFFKAAFDLARIYRKYLRRTC